MDLERSDDQAALAAAVREVLAREWPAAAMRHRAEEGIGDDALWARMVALDWPALRVPEADGGIGYGTVEAALVLEEAGRAVVGGPLFPTVALFVPTVLALATPEQRIRWLGAVATGATTATVALADLLRADGSAGTADQLGTVAVRRGDGSWRLDGTARTVIEAPAVDLLVVPATVGAGGIGVFVVPVGSPGVRVTPVRSLDTTRRLATIELAGVRVDADDALGPPGEPAVARGLAVAADESVTLLAAELVGTCGAIFDLTLDHAKTRVQFGVPIGSFQAVKHRLADAYLALEAARAAVLVAAAAVDEDDPGRAVAASTAKALAGDCAALLATEGIQLLGGLGFTWEHDMHLFVKRATASSVVLGTAEVHRQRVAERIGLVA